MADPWEEVHDIFLQIGEALMSIGTSANMGQEWYAMLDKLIDRGVTIAYKGKTDTGEK